MEMDTMSPFSHQHDPNVALYTLDNTEHNNTMLTSNGSWSLGLSQNSSMDFSSMTSYAQQSAQQPRHLPNYFTGSDLQASPDSPNHSSSPGSRPMTASLPLLNPSIKRTRDDNDSLSPDSPLGCINPQDANAFAFLDPSSTAPPATLDPTSTLTTHDSSSSTTTLSSIPADDTPISFNGHAEEDVQLDDDFGEFLDDEHEAGPMEEGEQVLRLGNIKIPTASTSTSNATTTGKKRKTTTTANSTTQKLLAEVSPDEDGKGNGRKKIQIEYIQDKSRRHITFSKRKAGIMKKAYELSTLTGTQVLLLVVSETGTVFTYTTNKLQPLVAEEAGKALIRECLEQSDSESTNNNSNLKHGGHVALKTKASANSNNQNSPAPSLNKRPSAGNLRAKRSAANLRAAAQQQAVPASAPPPMPNMQQMDEQHRMHMQEYYYQQQQQMNTQYATGQEQYMIPRA